MLALLFGDATAYWLAQCNASSDVHSSVHQHASCDRFHRLFNAYSSGGASQASYVHEGARVEFNEGEDARQYENRIVECSWNGEDGVWRFMRARTDKHHPNAKHVYDKVMASIEDNIEEDDIIAEVAEAMKEPVYDKDRPPSAALAH